MTDNKINITNVRDLNAERLLAEAIAEVDRLRLAIFFGGCSAVHAAALSEAGGEWAVKAVQDVDGLRAEVAAVDAAISDRGVSERDCSLPLAQRVDNLILDLRECRSELAQTAMENEQLRAELNALWAKGPLLRLSRIDFGRMPVGGCEVMRVCYQADVLRRGKEPEEWFCNAEVVGEIRSDLSREANRMTMERAFHDLAQKLHDELLPLPDWFFKKTP